MLNQIFIIIIIIIDYAKDPAIEFCYRASYFCEIAYSWPYCSELYTQSMIA